MNKYVVTQIAGMVVLVLGAQGAVRLLLDHGHAGILGWLPGGFAAQLAGHAVLALLGVVVVGWADTQRKKRDAS